MRQNKKTAVERSPAIKRDTSRQKSIAKLKESLLARRKELRNYLNSSEDPTWGDESNVIHGDAADVAMSISRDEFSFQRVESASDELSLIERSLERIEDKTYGICETCEGMIPIARLRVLPFAGKCVICQQAEEEHRRNFTGASGWAYAGESEVGTGFF